MKKMITLMILALSANAFANSVNDMPNRFLSCQETDNGAVVLDGGKYLSLSKDQFGQVYLNVTQKDRLNQDRALLLNLPMRKISCNGYIPCEKYTSENQGTNVGINYGPKTEAFLSSSTLGQIDFICKK